MEMVFGLGVSRLVKYGMVRWKMIVDGVVGGYYVKRMRA
jgi:hypothetical protein